METLQVVELIEFKDFKEKVKLTKEYNRKAKIEIIDNKYVYVERIEVLKPIYNFKSSKCEL